jgi:outer membrane protein TolC
LIVSREAKLIDARRKLEQTAIKLSLFYRDANGQPIVPDASRLPGDFPEAMGPSETALQTDIPVALANRPELRVISFQQQQVEVELAQAGNQILPEVDAGLAASQDMGAPTSKKRDKSRFELEAALFVDVPIQRRKARGKIVALRGKRSQLLAKRRFVADKVVTDVQSIDAALRAAYERIGKARQSLELAQAMERAELRKFELGNSNLLFVNAREQQLADAAATQVGALLEYFAARAAYRRALGLDSQLVY